MPRDIFVSGQFSTRKHSSSPLYSYSFYQNIQLIPNRTPVDKITQNHLRIRIAKCSNLALAKDPEIFLEQALEHTAK